MECWAGTSCPSNLVCVVEAAGGEGDAGDAAEGALTTEESALIVAPDCWDQPATCQCCWDDNGAAEGGLRCTVVPAEIRERCP